MADYVLTITLKNVAEGDATSLADDIWDMHAESFDAAFSEFALHISKNGKWPVDWNPEGEDA